MTDPQPTFEETTDVFCEYPNCKRVASFYIGTDQTAVCVEHEGWSDSSLAVKPRESSLPTGSLAFNCPTCGWQDIVTPDESMGRYAAYAKEIAQVRADNERLCAALESLGRAVVMGQREDVEAALLAARKELNEE